MRRGMLASYRSSRLFIPDHGAFFPRIVQKMHKSLTHLATIRTEVPTMKTMAVISILALLTIGGAAYTDQLFTSDQGTAQRAN